MFRYMRCSATSIFYHFDSCSGIWVRACKARTAYTVLYAPSGVFGARVQRGRAVARSSKNIFRLTFDRLYLLNVAT
jgi:hypothetical protein